MNKHKNSKKPLISIIIAAGQYRKKELLYCLQTIFASSYSRYEVLVIDNSENLELSIEVKKKFPQTKLIKMPKNTGIFAYNVGFANAQGDLILTLDDDCSIFPNTLQNIKEAFSNKSSKVAVLSANVVNPDPEEFVFDYFNKNRIEQIYIFCGASVFRKEILEEVGYFDEIYFCWQHEVDLSLRILNKGFEIHHEPSIIVSHPRKTGEFRPNLLFYIYRNVTLFNWKHFSFIMIPILTLRDLIALINTPFKYRTVHAFLYGLTGYISGWLELYKAIKKREKTDWQTQIRFLRYYLFGKF